MILSIDCHEDFMIKPVCSCINITKVSTGIFIIISNVFAVFKLTFNSKIVNLQLHTHTVGV